MTMARDEFWALIEAARLGGGDAAEVAARLAERLAERTPEEIVAYLEQQGERMAESHSWALWGAAYVANGGCSNDGFDYFRGWLLAQGRVAFERVLADPDALAELISPDGEDLEAEEMIGVAASTYRKLTGDYPEMNRRVLPKLGDRWDFDDEDEMRRRYPRLCAKRLG